MADSVVGSGLNLTNASNDFVKVAIGTTFQQLLALHGIQKYRVYVSNILSAIMDDFIDGDVRKSNGVRRIHPRDLILINAVNTVDSFQLTLYITLSLLREI